MGAIDDISKHKVELLAAEALNKKGADITHYKAS